MEIGAILLYGLAMLVGLVGIVLPVVPGLVLIAGVTAVWAYDQGQPGAWVVFAVVLVVLLLGTIAKYVLPSRTLKAANAPMATLLLGLLGAVIGFFAIPVVGLLIGGAVGVYVGELVRLRGAAVAWRSTVATAKAFGLGLLLKLVAGVAAVAIWLTAALTLG